MFCGHLDTLTFLGLYSKFMTSSSQLLVLCLCHDAWTCSYHPFGFSHSRLRFSYWVSELTLSFSGIQRGAWRWCMKCVHILKAYIDGVITNYLMRDDFVTPLLDLFFFLTTWKCNNYYTLGYFYYGYGYRRVGLMLDFDLWVDFEFWLWNMLTILKGMLFIYV